MIYKYLNHAQCTTHTMVPTLLGREIMCRKSRFCSSVAEQSLTLMCLSECGGVIRKKQGHLLLESYPNNARCEWTIQVDLPFAVELR